MEMWPSLNVLKKDLFETLDLYACGHASLNYFITSYLSLVGLY